MKYLINIPGWIRILYPRLTWRIPEKEKRVYLTFDDGPCPEVTNWVLEQLEQAGFRATFFLIGHNIEKHTAIFEQLKASGHSLGNHTYHHLNGWQTGRDEYLDSFRKCDELMETDLFRPPYGRISRAQARQILPSHRVIMWSVVSADFDRNLSGETCAANVIRNIRPGSIIVFHDSEKAWPRLKTALPKVLEHLKKEGYTSEAL